ncbi:DBF4B protein, partial [Urocolius indicus]|nr:DBF4B protein [Urocolius indicus]
VTESFLSKEVTYVVSSNKEAKRDKGRAWAERPSSTTAKGAKAAGPVPSATHGSQTTPHQKPPDTVLISRGKELLQKAMKNQVSSDTCGGSSVLANARLWGVQILHVDGILLCRMECGCWGSGLCEPGAAEHSAPRAQDLHQPGLYLGPPKQPGSQKQFRPFHHQFKSFPSINFLAPKGCSPFEPLKSLSSSCRASAGENSPCSTPAPVPRRRRGFCECCQETFEELQKHLQSPGHERFARDASHYVALDRLIAQL